MTSHRTPTVRWLDRLLLAELVALTFLLGCFLDQDTDIWWHLRAGRDMWAGSGIPHIDRYLFGAQGAEWIDLHWGFQAVAAWLFGRYGFPALTVAAALAAAVAVSIALSATTRHRSVVAITWCWLPAIFLMSARFFPRPEVISLVCLAAVLAVLRAAEKRPALLWLLVPIQLLWVNMHSLFVLGWVVLLCWLIDQWLRGGMSRREPGWRHRWAAPIVVVIAAFANPYGWRGVRFPLTLFRRMSTEADFYGRHIGELMSIPAVIAQTGVGSVYLRISLLLLVATTASFALVRHRRPLPYYRGLALTMFAALGMLAIRNQPQFALIAGAVLAWNVGDWLAERRAAPVVEQAVARIVTSAVLVGLMLWVATGRFYAYTAEGRQVGLGEYPLWNAHAAAAFAARPEMPRHWLAYHEGQAAVLEFHMRPDQQVFVDPRLEVSPRTALAQYYELAASMGRRLPVWPDHIARLPQPLGVLVDHRTHHPLEAALLSDARWRCVWFDAVAGIYVPSDADGVAEHAIDFAARYFGAVADATASPAAAPVPRTALEQLQYAESLLTVGQGLLTPDSGSSSRGRVLMLMATAEARDLMRRTFVSPRAAQLVANGGLQVYPHPAGETAGQDLDADRMLGIARGRYFLEQALQQAPADFQMAMTLVGVAQTLKDPDALWVAASRVMGLRAQTAAQFEVQRQVRLVLQQLLMARAAEMPPLPPTNAAGALATARALITQHRFRRALDTVEGFIRDGGSHTDVTWELTDLHATLLVIAGNPARARTIWLESQPPSANRPLLDRRLAATYFVEGDLSQAVAFYRKALAADPRPPSGHFGLALSHLERGEARDFVAECQTATASGDLPREMAEFCSAMVALATPHIQRQPD